MVRRFVQRVEALADLLDAQAGVVSRAQLRERGIDRHAVRSEIEAGRWQKWGRQTVAIVVSDRAPAIRWSAILEVGAGARLDGVTSLVEAGLTGWRSVGIDIAAPRGKHDVARPGITVRTARDLPAPVPVGIPRIPVVPATLRAVQQAPSDAQAATLLAMVPQQRLAEPKRLLEAWHNVTHAHRRAFLDVVIKDVCDGAHALGELNFTRLCRIYGLPPPQHQVVLNGPGGRIYRDARWPGLTVEIDGVQHWAGLATIDDALRANAVTMSGDIVIRIPVLGLRLREAEFMRQVVRAYWVTRRPGSASG